MKIAIIHDYLNQFGGAERVVEGPHRKVLENLTQKNNIEFLGRVTDKELIGIYSK